MVPPLEYSRFITNLPFRATQKLELCEVKNFYKHFHDILENEKEGGWGGGVVGSSRGRKKTYDVLQIKLQVAPQLC